VHGLDVVAGAVEQIVRSGFGGDEMRFDQREIGVVQSAQQIVERPPAGRIFLSQNH
jgi:hypothetical protein